MTTPTVLGPPPPSPPPARPGRPRTTGDRVRTVVGVLGELLIAAGLLVLLFVAWQLWWTDVAAGRDQAATVSALSDQFEERGGGSGTPATPGATGATGGTSQGIPEGAFAVVRIPRLGGDWATPVLPGTDAETLRHGLGHYEDTAAPGKVGNFALAGHRTTWGRPLHDIDRLVAGDRIVVETQAGWSVYAVTSAEVVAPTAVEVIAPVPDQPGAEPTEAWLTLTSCHPRYSARERYVVHARLDRTYPRAAGLPAEVLAAPTSERSG
ncbi:MAG TPA: class E sortase [Dermatophilaceae bacterium]|nr:class E sortase [Dermatophilaceae bacterium]